MKKHFFHKFFALMLAIGMAFAPILPVALAASSSVDNKFAHGMVTLTFDGGYRSTYLNGMPILRAAGFNATHYIVTHYILGGFPGFIDVPQLLSLALAGDDIGNHTRDHIDLTSLTLQQQRAEIQNGIDDLHAMGVTSVPTFAPPFGAYTTDTIQLVKDAGFLGMRTSNGGFNDKSTDPFLLNRQLIVTSTPFSTIQGWIDSAVQNNTWVILEYHSIDPSPAPGELYSATPQMLQQVVDYLVSNHVDVITVAQGLKMLNTVVTSPTPSPTPTPSPSPTSTPSVTPSATPSPSPTPSVTPSETPSPTPTSSPTSTPTPTPTSSGGPSPTSTPSPTPSASASPTPAPSSTPAAVTASSHGGGGGGTGLPPGSIGNFTNPVRISKMVRNASAGDSMFFKSVTAFPGDILQFSVLVQPTGQVPLINATLSDAVAEPLEIMPGTVTVNGSTGFGDISQGAITLPDMSRFPLVVRYFATISATSVSATSAPVTVSNKASILTDSLATPVNDSAQVTINFGRRSGSVLGVSTGPSGTGLGGSFLSTNALFSGSDLSGGLYYGTQGSGVSTLQQRLAQGGFYAGPVTGYFDDLTRQAVQAYQGSHGMSADGYASPSLMRFLTTASVQAPSNNLGSQGQVLGASAYNFVSNLYVGVRGAAVNELQKILAKQKVYAGPITGYFGRLTEAGVKLFQKKHGVAQTGYVGAQTRSELNKVQSQ